MDSEIKKVKLMNQDRRVISGVLTLYEVSRKDPDLVCIRLDFDEISVEFHAEYFFEGLLLLRRHLEAERRQIMCNGAAKSVYPSPMQLSMGDGRLAYKLEMGQQAKMVDIVDIFAFDDTLEFVGVDEQYESYQTWLHSLIRQ